MLRNLTPEEYHSEKLRIIALLFNPYSNNNSDEYIQGQQVAKDKIQNRIDYQMIQNRISKDSKIQEDIYQMTFEQLLKMNEKNTKKFVDKYYKNPDSAYYFAFYLLKIKGFTIHPNNPEYPNHSLAKSIVYASAFKAENIGVNISETYEEGENEHQESVIIYDDG